MFNLQPLRHISTLLFSTEMVKAQARPCPLNSDSDRQRSKCDPALRAKRRHCRLARLQAAEAEKLAPVSLKKGPPVSLAEDAQVSALCRRPPRPKHPGALLTARKGCAITIKKGIAGDFALTFAQNGGGSAAPGREKRLYCVEQSPWWKVFCRSVS